MIVWIVPILFVIWLWIRLKFWNRQPITHVYSFYKKGVLSEHPIVNTYVVPKVIFYKTSDMTKEEENELYEYVKENQPSYHKKTHFMGYLKKAYISVYRENTCIRGCITSRHIDFTFDKETVDAYSTDFMYADTPHILKCLIQSHEYKKHVAGYPVSIFTSNTNLRFLVPITTYDIRWMYTRTFQKYTFPLKTKFVKAIPSSLNDVYSCLKKPFACQMSPSIYTLAALIESRNVSIYSIYNPFLVAILFFKNNYELEDDFSIVDWVGTFMVDPSDMNFIHRAISTVLYGIRKTFKIVRIHQVSDTPVYINQYKITQSRKYAYNYGIYALPPSQCFFL